MAINYTTLVAAKTTEGSIKRWVNRKDIPVTNILLEAEAWIYQHLRVREMMAEVTMAFSIGDTSEALPDGSGSDPLFLDPINFTPYENSTGLPYVHENALRRTRDEDGNVLEASEAALWTIKGTNMEIDVKLDAAWSGILEYYGQPAALAATTNETNFVTVRYPTMLRRACMAFAYEHMKDWSAMRDELALAQAAINEANATNEKYRRTMIYEGAHDG